MRASLLPFRDFGQWADGLVSGAAVFADPAADREAGERATAELAVSDALSRVCAQLRERLRAILDQPAVRDALFLASPSLDSTLDDWRNAPDSVRGQKIERALVRYFARMCGRATPFGLFSGVAVGRIGAGSDFELGSAAEHGRHTRLDNDYLFALSDALGKLPAVREALLYRPNDSLFYAAGRLRYAEAHLDGKVRSYRLVTVEPTDYLLMLIERARAGATLDQ
ncbi:MAG: lantibiotic dehydratase, partial [Myxococcota bacterium]